MLGAIALSAGVAGFLKLSPLIVCFVAGLLLANLPGAWKDEVRQALWRLERPLYLIFLVIVGASWRLDQWEGWVVMALFVVARAGSRFIGVRILAVRHPDLLSDEEERHLASSPMGGLAIAIVIGAEELFAGPTTSWIVHAVVFGSIVSELLPRFLKTVRPVVTVPAAMLARMAGRDENAAAGLEAVTETAMAEDGPMASAPDDHDEADHTSRPDEADASSSPDEADPSSPAEEPGQEAPR
jgi:Kef-type K+ transport system membrane component KefB